MVGGWGAWWHGRTRRTQERRGEVLVGRSKRALDSSDVLRELLSYRYLMVSKASSNVPIMLRWSSSWRFASPVSQSSTECAMSNQG